jgi:GH15 family glucan-1,4-alpha-glucosidase
VKRVAKVSLLVGLGLGLELFSPAARAVEPHTSVKMLPSSNGRAAIAYDRASGRMKQYLEHPYAFPQANAQSRNFAFDSYPGVRVGGAGNAGTWLGNVTPSLIEYVPGTSIVHAQRSISGLTVDEYVFAPITLDDNVAVTLVKVTRTSGTGNVDVYQLFNYHLGTGSPAPGTDAEQTLFDATRDAYYEYGPASVTFAHGSVSPSTKHTTTPDNPYGLLMSGADLPNTNATTGATNDAVPGFQVSVGNLAVGASGWAGFYSVVALDSNAAPKADQVRAWVAGRTPADILAAETSAWAAWLTPPPKGASAMEAALARSSQIVLRGAQVTESGAANGQIMASLPPGKWNITWVRDMAYATVGLVRSGHFAEAKAALRFQLNATSNTYQAQVGKPYQISVVRYFGNGTEESDVNGDGPNIEFDGFGLFLWALDEYVRASGDTTFAINSWSTISTKVADVLVSLQEPSGLIKADSSIWEVHTNGKERHFTYTTITAANGLCSAARLAKAAGAPALAATYQSAGEKARDALLAHLRAPDGTLGQSTEGLASGSQWLDAAVVEAINFGLVYPDRHTAKASLASIKAGLVPPSGRGFMRSNIPAWYDSQEWVFVDQRSQRAMELNGDTASASTAFSWNVAQAADNYNQLSELHDRVNADYAGEAPMVGFGAGAYLIALADRGTPVVPTCGAFASEPPEPGSADAGTAGGKDGGASAGGVDGGDAGTDPSLSQNGNAAGKKDNDGGCSSTGGTGNGAAGFAFMAAALAAFLKKRMTKKQNTKADR